MTDRVSKDTRSKVMSTVRSKGTKLETIAAQVLAEHGLDVFEQQPDGIAGRPDFAHRNAKIVIFVDSCFWHGCPHHLRRPASNREYWEHKVARNRRRDRLVRQQLKDEGWQVVRIWEHELPDAPSLKGKITRLKNTLRERGAS
jgi:DNA mismatch endonuclease (patch repair protein)